MSESDYYRAGRAGRWIVDRWSIWLRLALAFYLFTLIAPAQGRIPVEPPFTVQTNHPILCTHTRLDLEVYDLDIYRTLGMIREMGATRAVVFFYWAYLQPARDRFDWDGADRIVALAERQGVAIIARLGLVPAWARPDPISTPTTLEYLDAEHFDDYAAFVAAFAARYRDRIKLIVPWNEPNLAFEWGGRKVSPAEYVTFLKTVYQAAKAANPDVQILGAALAPTLAPPEAPDALSDILFLRGIYQAGGKGYFDALAVHTYGFTLPHDDPPASDRLNFRRFELLLGVMREFDDGDKPVYITESSWNDHPRWLYAVRPGQRITYSLGGLDLIENRWPTVKALCFWFFRAPLLFRTYQDNFALVTVDFRPRPIYEEIRRWARGQ